MHYKVFKAKILLEKLRSSIEQFLKVTHNIIYQVPNIPRDKINMQNNHYC